MKILAVDENKQPTRFEMIRPDNWHGHLRDEGRMESVVGFSAEQYARMTIMPNTGPINTLEKALAYRKRITEGLISQGFEQSQAQCFPYMTLYLDGQTTPQMVAQAKRAGISGFKFYPKNPVHGTTGADQGVPTLFDLQSGVLETMEKLDMHLLLHGESVNCSDILDLERFFVSEQLEKVASDYPELRVCLEHVSTKEGVWFVESAGDNITATITPQHLWYSINSLFEGGLRVHRYCLPAYKHEPDRVELVRAAISGNQKFCAGDDTAPHPEHGPSGKAKLSACGCAGAFVAPVSVPMYVEAFAKENALDNRFEQFMSVNGALARKLPINSKKIIIEQHDWQVPERYTFGEDDHVVPLCAGETMKYRLAS
jgi:dihydroorotase